MFADSRFDYLHSVRFFLSYTATPVYCVAELTARTPELFDRVFASQSHLLAANDRLHHALLLAQR